MIGGGVYRYIPPVTRMTFPDRSEISASGLKLGPPPNMLKIDAQGTCEMYDLKNSSVIGVLIESLGSRNYYYRGVVTPLGITSIINSGFNY